MTSHILHNKFCRPYHKFAPPSPITPISSTVPLLSQSWKAYYLRAIPTSALIPQIHSITKSCLLMSARSHLGPNHSHYHYHTLFTGFPVLLSTISSKALNPPKTTLCIHHLNPPFNNPHSQLYFKPCMMVPTYTPKCLSFLYSWVCGLFEDSRLVSFILALALLNW